MAKTSQSIKESLSKIVDGVLLIEEEDIFVGVKGEPEAIPFRELYSYFDKKEVTITIKTKNVFE